MADDLLRVRIVSSLHSREADLTVAELGVLLTALNRSLNKLALESPDIGRIIPDAYYSPFGAEPVFVQLHLVSARKGSFELQAAVNLLETVGLDYETAKTLLLGIIGSALASPTQTATFIYDFRRALNRVARGSVGKTIQITFALGRASVRLVASISDSAKVQVTAESVPPDDVQ